MTDKADPCGLTAEARDEWQSVVFTLMGHAACLYASGQHDMPRWFYELAEKIAREHVDEAHAVRAREVGVQQRAKYGCGEAGHDEGRCGNAACLQA
jgi:hypothetical protein